MHDVEPRLLLELAERFRGVRIASEKKLMDATTMLIEELRVLPAMGARMQADALRLQTVLVEAGFEPEPLEMTWHKIGEESFELRIDGHKMAVMGPGSPGLGTYPPLTAWYFDADGNEIPGRTELARGTEMWTEDWHEQHRATVIRLAFERRNLLPPLGYARTS